MTATRDLGLEGRTGIHVSEVEQRGDDIGGNPSAQSLIHLCLRRVLSRPSSFVGTCCRRSDDLLMCRVVRLRDSLLWLDMRRRGSGDDEGFTIFVDAHERRLRQALTAFLGPLLGREATVEALSYGWEHWARVSQMDNPVGYLFVVGRDRATRHRRRRRDRPVERPMRPSDDPTIWFEPALPALVEDLSDRERQVVMLVHGFEWSLSEVAELLGVSKSTVQTYSERGLSKLREGLGVTS